MDLAGKTIWITGASSGIGEALAYELAARGARLLLSARRADELERVRLACARLEDHRVVPLDLAEPASLEAAARDVFQRSGPPEVMVHNGGISQRSRAEDTDRPPSASSPAGFQSRKMRSPLGEPSSVTSSTGSPHSSEASRPGSPMVAEVNTKVGDEP